LIRSTTSARLAIASLALCLMHCSGTPADRTNGAAGPAPTPGPAHAEPPAAPPAPAQAVQPAEAGQPAEYKNTVRWSTASEVENFGFDVYRGDSAEGPWTRLTEQPVLGAGTSDEVHKYEYVDRSIDPHKAYYYWVESISITGVREHFTPVIAAKAKIQPAP
jgi:hypothetical protein